MSAASAAPARSFRRAFDACNTPFNGKSARDDDRERDATLLALIRNSPRASSLTLNGDNGLGWAAVLRAGGPALCGRLRQLRLLNMLYMAELPLLSAFVGLQELQLAACRTVKQLPELSACTALTRLELDHCSALRDLLPLAGLATHGALLHLSLFGCASVTDFSALSACTSLLSLNLAHCDALHDLSPLACCSSLRQLDVSRCPRITSLTSLAALSALQQLSFHGITSALLPQLQHAPTVTHLDLSHFTDCRLDLRAPQHSPLHQRMRCLVLSHCRNLSDISAVAFAPSLVRLCLAGCITLKALQPLSNCSALTDLNLSGLRRPNLGFFSNLSLCHLDLSNTDRGGLWPLTSFQSLRTLNLASCCRVADLGPLSCLTALERLHLSRRCAVVDLRPLAAAPAVPNCVGEVG